MGFGSLISKDLDPRKAELLRQAQLRVLAKRKSAEKQSGESPPVGDEAKPAGAEAGPEDGAGKPSWQQKLDIALARRRSQNAAKEAGEGDAEATEHKPDAKLSDQIDTKLKLMREQRQKEADGTDNAGDGNPEAEAVEAETPAECES